ncbi:DUF1127 domain-containing protein [Roseovarius arcticus]|uniref:DUF1127 domain-containing protein n=1 Tax=Roseovarius arcticus TaxID=2547404 RepID=UPI001FEA5F98|nr:DUF1127 domain-containing protein [Roseovarius arcticus]
MSTLAHNCPMTAKRTLRLSTVITLARSRRALAGLDNAALRDVGLTPSEARIEARRPFWDLPRAWRGGGC